MTQIIKLNKNEIEKSYLGKWTLFWDMHSGGSNKYKGYNKIYVQGSKNAAISLFENVTGEDPYDVACQCCGENYSIDEEEDFIQATGFHRNCNYDNKLDLYLEESKGNGYSEYITIENYIQKKDVLLIFSNGSTNK